MPKNAIQSKSKRTRKPPIYTIGIDLGGTKVAAGLVNRNGALISEVHRPTVPAELENQNPRLKGRQPSASEVRHHISYVTRAMSDAAIELLDSHPNCHLSGVGLASAGPMNVEKGTLDLPANFRGWKIVPLVRLFASELARRGVRQPVYFQNDAVAAALGEGWVGRAKGCATYAMITVGTGIGSGVILNGRPSQSRGMGSEWGHMLIETRGLGADRGSFDSRSVESIASGTGLVRRARAAGLPCETAHELAELTRAKNPAALQLFSQASEALAALFYNLSLGYHLEKIVVSGGMLAVKEFFLPEAIAIYREIMLAKNRAFLAPVQAAQLGTKAGVIGAARLPALGSF